LIEARKNFNRELKKIKISSKEKKSKNLVGKEQLLSLQKTKYGTGMVVSVLSVEVMKI
jgi:hypothetical protein